MCIKIYLACISEQWPTDSRPPWIFRQGDKFTQYDPHARLATGTAVCSWTACEHMSIPEQQVYIRERAEQVPKLADLLLE